MHFRTSYFTFIHKLIEGGWQKTIDGLRVFLSLPNIITSVRIILIWPIIELYQEGSALAFCLYLLAILTDFLDGQTARWLKKQNSSFGKIYDPLADKVLNFGVLYLFVTSGYPIKTQFWIMLFLAFVLLSMPGFKAYFKIQRKLGANIFGKIKFWLESVAIIALFQNWVKLGLTLINLAILFAILSILGHILIKEESKKKFLKKFLK